MILPGKERVLFNVKKLIDFSKILSRSKGYWNNNKV